MKINRYQQKYGIKYACYLVRIKEPFREIGGIRLLLYCTVPMRILHCQT